jgi:3-mercaptopyruvate sulfurtransferase SseA
LLSLATIPSERLISGAVLDAWLTSERDSTVVLDFARSVEYARSHIPGALFALRSRLEDALRNVSGADRLVLTSPDGLAARFAWLDVTALVQVPVFVLDGGTASWSAAGLGTTNERARYASPPIDRYRRPYEGTDIEPAAMQAYLDWEYGLVAQLEKDGTHGFKVL